MVMVVLCAIFVAAAAQMFLYTFTGMSEQSFLVLTVGLVVGWYIGKMLLERALSQLQEDFVKVQIVFPPESAPVLPQVTPLHHSSTGRVHTFILKCGAQAAEQAARACQPVFYDILPLTLEEIFIYELGGVNYEVKNIIL